MMLSVTCLPVRAAGEGNPQSGTTNLSVSKDSSYTLTIPASQKNIIYGATSTELGDLLVTGNVDVGKEVTVSVTKHVLVRAGSPSDTITFALVDHTGNTAAEYVATTWNETELRAGTKNVPLTVDITQDAWDSAKAGSYIGSIVFAAQMN